MVAGGRAAAKGDTKSQKRKKQPLFHLPAQKRKSAGALQAAECSAPERLPLSLPLTGEDLGGSAAPAGHCQHLQGRGRGRPAGVATRDYAWACRPSTH